MKKKIDGFFFVIKHWAEITPVIDKQINWWKKKLKRKCTELLVIFRKSTKLCGAYTSHCTHFNAFVELWFVFYWNCKYKWWKYYLILIVSTLRKSMICCELPSQHVKISKHLTIEITMKNVTMTEHMAHGTID